MLNPDLDVARLAAHFGDHRRIQIDNALDTESANALVSCLENDVPWTTAYIGATGPRYLSRDEFKRLDTPQQQKLLRDINQRANRDFQYLYDSYAMVPAYQEGRDPGLLLHQVLEYFNSPEYHNFARAVTGEAGIHRVDGQATRYLSGHFLKHHNDTSGGEKRLVAYVLNLTRNWEAHWGGLLQFLNREGEVVDTFMPHFNSLSLFKVPAWHCVSYVAPFAQAPRYAITGWFRAL